MLKKSGRAIVALYRGRCAGDSGIARRLASVLDAGRSTMIIGTPISSDEILRRIGQRRTRSQS